MAGKFRSETEKILKIDLIYGESVTRIDNWHWRSCSQSWQVGGSYLKICAISQDVLKCVQLVMMYYWGYPTQPVIIMYHGIWPTSGSVLRSCPPRWCRHPLGGARHLWSLAPRRLAVAVRGSSCWNAALLRFPGQAILESILAFPNISHTCGQTWNLSGPSGPAVL